MDRINTAQLEIGRDRWQAVQAYAGFDLFGTLAKLTCPVLNALWREIHLRNSTRGSGACRLPTRDARDRAGRALLHDLERAADIAQHAGPSLPEPRHRALARIQAGFGLAHTADAVRADVKRLKRSSRRAAAVGQSATTAPASGWAAQARKLDYVLKKAIEQGADTLVSGAWLQSNSQRQVAAAAAKLRPCLPSRDLSMAVAPPSADTGRPATRCSIACSAPPCMTWPWNGRSQWRDPRAGLSACAARAGKPFRSLRRVRWAGRGGLCVDRHGNAPSKEPGAHFARRRSSTARAAAGTQAGLIVGCPRLPAQDARRRQSISDAEPERACGRMSWPAARRRAALLSPAVAIPPDVEVVAGHAGPAYGVAHEATIEAIKLGGDWKGWCSIRSIPAKACRPDRPDPQRAMDKGSGRRLHPYRRARRRCSPTAICSISAGSDQVEPLPRFHLIRNAFVTRRFDQGHSWFG